MHYLENKIELKDLVITLYKDIPEFFDYSVFDKNDEMYPVFSEFGRFILANIDSKILVEKSIDFISLLIESNNNAIETLIVIELFWPIYNSGEKDIQVFRSQLSIKGRKIFNDFLYKFKNK